MCRGRRDRNGGGQEECPARRTVCADREGRPLDPHSDCAVGGGGLGVSCQAAASSSGWKGLRVDVRPVPETGR